MKEAVKKEILHVLPVNWRSIMGAVLDSREEIQEIRMRTGRPMSVYADGKEEEIKGQAVLSSTDLQETMEFVSRFSLYAYEEELRQGFITIKGGHRVGIAGKAAMQDGHIKTMRSITFIHIRIARACVGCGESLLPWLCEGHRLKSTLIFSAPGMGKTTLMRDLIRLISNGSRYAFPLTVSVIDERGELAACDRGIPQHDLGKQTDVLDGCPKTIGMRLMLRSMTPQVLAVDEIGSMEDGEALMEAAGCGCVILATAHGEGLDRIMQKKIFRRMKEENLFERYVELKGEKAGDWTAVYNSGGVRLC